MQTQTIKVGRLKYRGRMTYVENLRRGTILLFFLVPMGISQPLAQGKSLPLDLQAGFEQNEVTLIRPGEEDSQTTADPEYSSKPVFKIISPIKLGCLAFKQTFNSGTDAQRDGCIGFGIRVSGAQKRLKGRWFDLTSDSTAEPTYTYRADQIAGEVLFGQLSEVSLAWGLGVRAGANNYDLLVSNGDQILFQEDNRVSSFASWALYLDLQVLLTWPFFGMYYWPFDHVYFLYSYEETIDGKNNFMVPDINGTGSIEVEMKTLTQTLTLEFIF